MDRVAFDSSACGYPALRARCAVHLRFASILTEFLPEIRPGIAAGFTPRTSHVPAGPAARVTSRQRDE